MKLEGHSEATSLFELKDQPSKSENESSSSSSWHNHKRMEAFIGNVSYIESIIIRLKINLFM